MFATEIISRSKEIEKIQNAYAERLKREEYEQVNSEKEYLRLHPICNSQDVYINNINYKQLETELSENFDNIEVLLLMACITRAIALVTPRDGISIQDRIHHWFTDIRVLSSGAFGETLLLKLKDFLESFIIKVPNHRNDFSVLHEFFITDACTNQLRSFVPNFAFLYGGFSCTHPVEDEMNRVADWCTKGTGVQYLIYERIIPGDTVARAIQTFTEQSFLGLLFQICCSLSLAYKKYKFTHYDLHNGNIILRKLKGTSDIIYETAYGNYFLHTDTIATIIDFGLAHVQINGKDYGPHDLVVDRFNRPFECYDIFVLLSSIDYSLSNYNRVVGQIARKLLSWFSSDNFAEVYRQYGSRPYLPYLEKYAALKLDDFIGFMLTTYHDSFSTLLSDKPQYPLIGCNNDIKFCADRASLLSSLKLNISLPSDPFEFVDFYYGSPVANRQQLLNSYNGSAAIRTLVEEYRRLKGSLIFNLPILSLKNADPLTLLDKNAVLDPYLNYLALLANSLYYFDRMINIYNLYKFFINKRYRSIENPEFINHKAYADFLNERFRLVRDDISFFNDIPDSPLKQQYMKKFKWYTYLQA